MFIQNKSHNLVIFINIYFTINFKVRICTIIAPPHQLFVRAMRCKYHQYNSNQEESEKCEIKKARGR